MNEPRLNALAAALPSDLPYYENVIRKAHEALSPLLSVGPNGTALMTIPDQTQLWKLHAAFGGLTRAVEYLDRTAADIGAMSGPQA